MVLDLEIVNNPRVLVAVGSGLRPDVGKPHEESILRTPFSTKLDRLVEAFKKHSPGDDVIPYRDELPPRCPPHLEVPYAFKAYAIEEAIRRGYRYILWVDSSVIPILPLQPMWDLVVEQGYWIPKNQGWNCGQWTCDSALELLGITREEAFDIPQIAATAFCLDVQNDTALEFYLEYSRLARNGSFCGSWINDKQQASGDRRVLVHRHDQTAASVAAYRLGMTLTEQPKIFTDSPRPGDGTLMVVSR